MYHLSGDFAGGMLLWAMGTLAAAAFTGSRGARPWRWLPQASGAGCGIFEVRDPHFSFLVVWLIAAGLALAWKSRVAAHLVAVAAVNWWIAEAVQFSAAPSFLLAYGAALLFGAGLALAATPWPSVSSAGAVLSIYGAFGLAGAAIFQVLIANEVFYGKLAALSQPLWRRLAARPEQSSPSSRLRQRAGPA